MHTSAAPFCSLQNMLIAPAQHRCADGHAPWRARLRHAGVLQQLVYRLTSTACCREGSRQLPTACCPTRCPLVTELVTWCVVCSVQVLISGAGPAGGDVTEGAHNAPRVGALLHCAPLASGDRHARASVALHTDRRNVDNSSCAAASAWCMPPLYVHRPCCRTKAVGLGCLLSRQLMRRRWAGACVLHALLSRL
jgi:hypothetical protein